MSSPPQNMDPAYLQQDSSNSLIAVAIAFIVLDILVAVLRLVAQRMSKRSFGLDDFCSYAGLIFILGQCVIALIQPWYAGVGRHVEYVAMYEPEKIEHEYIIMYPLAIGYISAFTFPKLAILFLYLRVFTSKPIRTTTWILLGVVVATWLAETLTAIFRCWPIEYVWNHNIEGTCVNQNAMFQYWSVPNIVTDLVMLVLPMRSIWSIHAPRYQKIALTCTFLLGSLGLVAAIVRFSIFSQVGALDDATWASVPLQQWTIVEPSMYFMAGILPTLRCLASATWDKMRTTTARSAPRTNYDSKSSQNSDSSHHFARHGTDGESYSMETRLPELPGIHPGTLKDQSDRSYTHQSQFYAGNETEIGRAVTDSTADDRDNRPFTHDDDGSILRTREFMLTREAV